jgi:GntR family transcriptional regulator of vanillate catabolism
MPQSLAVSPGQTVATVVEYIKTGIRSGHMSPGQRLVASELSARLGVSLGVVREALSLLDGTGLVQVLPNRGAQITSLAPSDVRQIFELREALEGQAAALAARNIRRAGATSRLREAFRAADRAARAGDINSYRTANYELHQTILDLADNERLRAMASDLTIPIYPLQLHMLLDGSEMAAAAAGHRTIVDAILAGDAEAARLSMQVHVRLSGAVMVRLVEATAPPLAGRAAARKA